MQERRCEHEQQQHHEPSHRARSAADIAIVFGAVCEDHGYSSYEKAGLLPARVRHDVIRLRRVRL